MLVGEDDDIACMGDGQDELHLVFNFPHPPVHRATPSLPLPAARSHPVLFAMPVSLPHGVTGYIDL